MQSSIVRVRPKYFNINLDFNEYKCKKPMIDLLEEDEAHGFPQQAFVWLIYFT